jgi:hypothetical protein
VRSDTRIAVAIELHHASRAMLKTMRMGPRIAANKRHFLRACCAKKWPTAARANAIIWLRSSSLSHVCMQRRTACCSKWQLAIRSSCISTDLGLAYDEIASWDLALVIRKGVHGLVHEDSPLSEEVDMQSVTG